MSISPDDLRAEPTRASLTGIIEFLRTSLPLRGHISGLVPNVNASDSSHDIDISAGEAADDGNAALMVLDSTLVKQIDASWAQGTNQGGLDGTESVAGTPDAATWYYLWLIRNPATNTVDGLFSESASSPTMPSGYTQKRRLGAVLTNGSATITSFLAMEVAAGAVRFLWTTPVNDVSTAAQGASDVTRTLTVPTGIGDLVTLLSVLAWNTGGSLHYILLRHPSLDSVATSSSNFTVATRNQAAYDTGDQRVEMECDTNGQIVSRGSAASTNLVINTHGWVDFRLL